MIGKYSSDKGLEVGKIRQRRSRESLGDFWILILIHLTVRNWVTIVEWFHRSKVQCLTHPGNQRSHLGIHNHDTSLW